jgi:hypothetical protein
MGDDSVLGEGYVHRPKDDQCCVRDSSREAGLSRVDEEAPCLIPADGFYEWKKIGPKKKQPYNIGMADDGLFAFAGLWDRWTSPDKGEVLSSTPVGEDIGERKPKMSSKKSKAS